jgi:hypothetical protein
LIEMRRWLSLSIAFGFLVLLAPPAAATCVIQPLRQVVGQVDAIWYGTITDAAASVGESPGTWTVTVDVQDVLKGEDPGPTATVGISGCGPLITADVADKSAHNLIGETRLFLIYHTRNGFLNYSEVASPQGMTAAQEYRAALRIVGRAEPSTTPIPMNAHDVTHATDALPWLATAALVLIAITAIAMSRRRRAAGSA